MLKTFFVSRECYTLVRPMEDESILQKLNQQPFNTLRPEFQEQVISLRKRLTTKCRLKSFRGQEVSGFFIAHMVEKWVNAINTGAVPDVENAFNQVSTFENEKL